MVTVGLLAGCAAAESRQEQTELQANEEAMYDGWSDSEFFPNEYCWRVYAQRDDGSALYWKIRHWCDQREMRQEYQP
jgi:hypothetical protein